MEHGRVELEIDDLTKGALKKLVKTLMSADDREKALDKAKEDEELESEDRANLKEETNGKGPAPKVTSEDIPKAIRDKAEEDEDEDEDKKDK